MKFQKAPPWLVTLFDEQLAGTLGERRLMFGYPAGFLGGNMFTGVFGDRMIVRLSESDRAALLKVEGAEIFDPMGGRPMKEYVVLPREMLEDQAELGPWLARAEAYARTLRPKSAGARAKSKKKPAKRRP